MIQKRKNQTEFSFISPEIVSEDYGKFTNYQGETEMYWNKVDDLKGLESTIEKGFSTELARQNKTPYRKYSDQEFIDDVLQNRQGMEETTAKNNLTLNKILYGPPGTGKTFRLQDKYFEDFTVRETSLTREQYLENIVSDLKWWQVAAIALLDLKKSKVTDIVSHELLLIKTKLTNSKNPNATLWGYLQHYTDPECENVKVAERSSNPIFYKDENSFWEVKEDLLEQFYPEAFSLLEEIKNHQPNPEKLISEGIIPRCLHRMKRKV